MLLKKVSMHSIMNDPSCSRGTSCLDNRGYLIANIPRFQFLYISTSNENFPITFPYSLLNGLCSSRNLIPYFNSFGA